jgi:hypothetical protein
VAPRGTQVIVRIQAQGQTVHTTTLPASTVSEVEITIPASLTRTTTVMHVSVGNAGASFGLLHYWFESLD